MTVEVRKEKILKFAIAAVHVFTKSSHIKRQLLYVERCFDVAAAQVAIGGLDEVCDLKINQTADNLMAGKGIQSFTASPTDALVDDLPKGNAIQLICQSASHHPNHEMYKPNHQLSWQFVLPNARVTLD